MQRSAVKTSRARLTAAVLALGLVTGLSVLPARADTIPTPEQIAAEQAKADRLEQQAKVQGQAVDAAQASLSTLAGRAATALEAYNVALAAEQAARAKADAARAAETVALQQLAVAKAATDQTMGDLKRYTAAVYRSGYTAGIGELVPLLDSESPSDFAAKLELWGRTGDGQGRLLDQLERQQAEQDRLARAAAAARETIETQEVAAAEARSAAQTAKAQADRLAAEQQQAVNTLQSAQNATLGAAKTTEQRVANMKKARAEELQRQREEAARRAREQAQGIPSLDGGTAGCANPYTETRGGYRNGCIPLSALSRLESYSYHYLRGDAASAFNAMSRAYAEQFGSFLCVTDSYRSYPQQVALKKAKGSWAATPGTSNHGWGLATDLCGGINSFGTTTHNWMRANAPRFGWYHPSWAQQGGSKPEPWHWEFGG